MNAMEEEAEGWQDSDVAWSDAEDDDASAADDANGDDDAAAWAGNAWPQADEADSGSPADWLAAAVPMRRTKPIETIKVGVVETPYKRRNGYHVEVAVQHPGVEESIHRLWFGFEVLDDVAKLRGGDRFNINVERFGEAVIGFLQRRGVDLADEDWGLQDDSIPFSVQHLPMRTLFDYYPDLMEALATECCAQIADQVADASLPPPHSDEELDAPLLFDRPFIDLGEPARSSKEELQAAVDRGFQGGDSH